MRRLATIVVAALAGAVGVVLGLSWLAARSLVMPRRRSLSRTPADLGLDFEATSLEGADGIALAAWWVAAARPLGTVILVHGFRSTRNEMLDHAPYLHEAGLDVLLYDSRACGESGGALSTMGWREQADLRAVIDQVATRTEARPVLVMAHSLGAATAILEGSGDDRIWGFVLEAPFTAIDDVVDRGFRHFTRPHLPAFPFARLAVRLAEAMVGQHRDAVRPIDAIDQLAPRPVLLVSGGYDYFVPPDDARRLADRAGASCTWWLIPEAGHSGSDRDPFTTAADEYRRRVLEVFETALDAAPQSAATPPTTGSSVA